MALINLAVRFIAELVGIGALAYWGLNASEETVPRLALAIGAPLVLIAIWAVVVAPAANNPIDPRLRSLIGTALLLVAAAALALAGRPGPAAAYASVVLLNQALLLVMPADADAMFGGAGSRS
jgi:hypothetical protein